MWLTVKLGEAFRALEANLRLDIEKRGLCTPYACILCGVCMHEIACRCPKERVVLVKRAKSFTFNRTIFPADFRQPERHQRLTPCCTLWKKP